MCVSGAVIALSQVLTIPGTATTVQLVMIDTVILAGLTHPLFRNLPPTGPASSSQAETEWQWIEETLVTSKADWIIMGGHYPGDQDGRAQWLCRIKKKTEHLMLCLLFSSPSLLPSPPPPPLPYSVVCC